MKIQFTKYNGDNDGDETLTSRAVKGISYTLSSKILIVLSQLITLLVLARILTPEDYGLVAYVSIFTGIATHLMEAGISTAIIQRKIVNHSEVSNLFWVSFSVSSLLTIVFIILGYFISYFYSDIRYFYVFSATSLVFIFSGASIQHDAILRRGMQFKEISILDLTAKVLSSAIGVSSAVYGLGYWSLVYMTVSYPFILSLLRWIYSGWLPSFYDRTTKIYMFLNVSSFVLIGNIINYIIINVVGYFIHYIGGLSSLGYYNRSLNIATIFSKQFLTPMIAVTQPAFSKLQGNNERVSDKLMLVYNSILLLSVVTGVILYCNSNIIIDLLLGDAWISASELFQYLIILSVLGPVSNFLSVGMNTLGKVKELAIWRVFQLLLIVLECVIGSNWGWMGVVMVSSVSGVMFRFPLFIWFVSKYIPLKRSVAIFNFYYLLFFVSALLFLDKILYSGDNHYNIYIFSIYLSVGALFFLGIIAYLNRGFRLAIIYVFNSLSAIFLKMKS
ncbi:oligosaccharide flippase family protein [Marinobacterium mangrovicola]|uniref:PST family polysaccharide transporter n=1 Tax=Marinobacterium mangrovicola TaxID=1476959 RepID=A0A4R1GHD2_9GAMM|nr:oligosaccharide flippase family protein [Marinobacterium mangrovicola]TCK07538.1 PST family polysaccharide transporter [Marinobacterium mangrovicola]